MIKARYPNMEVYLTRIPESSGKDITDYFKNGGMVDNLVTLCSEKTSGIEIGKFLPLK